MQREECAARVQASGMALIHRRAWACAATIIGQRAPCAVRSGRICKHLACTCMRQQAACLLVCLQAASAEQRPRHAGCCPNQRIPKSICCLCIPFLRLSRAHANMPQPTPYTYCGALVIGNSFSSMH